MSRTVKIYAREAIVYLMCARVVHHLSIMPQARARSDGRIQRDQVTPYYGRFNEVSKAHYR
ncbi:MAG: hypothetical protein KF850_19095 [Labilithrix sp.]|nr:hypothetical protein [Labilithrix sp.]MBX3214149.1 hypothetical protein [Labilithrix sp.]